MSTPLVTYNDALQSLGDVPNLGDCPTATNICNLREDLCDKLEAIPSHQSNDYGFRGMIESTEKYDLMCPDKPWKVWPNPGNHQPVTVDVPAVAGGRITKRSLTREEQADAAIAYDANRIVYELETNVHRAVNTKLNGAIPKRFKRSPDQSRIGSINFKASDCPRTIFDGLTARYSRPTPAEKTANEALWSTGWNPQDPIKELFERLEECYVIALVTKPQYTKEQMIDKTVVAIQATCLFEAAMEKWHALGPEDQAWLYIKEHFGSAFDVWLTSGAVTGASGGYHGANMGYDDDDSISTIGEKMTEMVNNVTRAHNANSVVTSEGIIALKAEGIQQRQEIAQLRMEMANLLCQTQTQVAPAYVPPTYAPAYVPAPAYAPAPPAPAYAPAAPATTGGGGRSKKGRSNMAAYGTVAPAVYPPAGPPSRGNCAIPPPAKPASNRANLANPIKHFNNWNYCYSCGGDVPAWHSSTTCPAECRKSHHQIGCDRANYQQYLDLGHWASKKAMKKTQLPPAGAPA